MPANATPTALLALDEQLRALLHAEAALTPAERRARSAAAWTAQQRHQEDIDWYNAQVEMVNRERGRAANERQALAVRAKTCMKCFQIPAANGVCGC